MYTAVLMLAMTTGTDAADFGRRGGCGGCNGGYGGYCGGGYCGGGGFYGGGCCSSGGVRMGYYGPGGSYYASGFTYANGMAYRTINGSTIVNGGTTRESFYPAQDQQNAVNVRVIVPNPEAEIWFDNTPTQQRGTERFFVSGPVEQGNYSYSIKGRWMQNGQAVERTRTVRVQPGQPVTVDLRAEQGEALPQPNRNPNNPPPPNPQNPPNNKTVPPSP